MAGYSIHRLFAIAAVLLAAMTTHAQVPSTTPALPTARQYDLARSAVQSAIADQKTKVLQASGYLKNPQLKEHGTTTISTGLAEIKRLEGLLQQTVQAANRNYPLPMAAIDLAISATATQSSRALAARDFQTLSRTAQDITGLIELQRGAPVKAAPQAIAAQPLVARPMDARPLQQTLPVRPTVTAVPARVPASAPVNQAPATSR